LGGGLYAWREYPELTGNRITNNTAGTNGGGVRLWYCGARLANNIIAANSAGHGGGVAAQSWSPTLTANDIAGNSASVEGGGVFLRRYSSAKLVNNEITGNSAPPDMGGGLYLYQSCSPTLTNNTIASNAGGGLVNYGTSSYPAGTPRITNCILWGSIAGLDLDGPSNTTYSDVGTPPMGGMGNISQDPNFVNAGDYHLQYPSACIDAGTNSAMYLPLTDRDGNPRIVDGNGDAIAVADMGAYEWQPPTDGSPSTVAQEIPPPADVASDPAGEPSADATEEEMDPEAPEAMDPVPSVAAAEPVPPEEEPPHLPPPDEDIGEGIGSGGDLEE
jgi:parallel beta-helix repeat protein